MLKALFHCLLASTVAKKFDAIRISSLCMLPVLSPKKFLGSSVCIQCSEIFRFLYWVLSEPFQSGKSHPLVLRHFLVLYLR